MKYKLLFLALGIFANLQLFATPAIMSFGFHNQMYDATTLAVTIASESTILYPIYSLSRTGAGVTGEDVNLSIEVILTTNGVEEVLNDPINVTGADFNGPWTSPEFSFRIKSITVPNQKLINGKLQLKYRYFNYAANAWVENQKSVTAYGTKLLPTDQYPDDFIGTPSKYNTVRKPAHNVPPANAWFPSETTPVMRRGDRLLSNNGLYVLSFQSTDGNLVLSNTATGAVLWSIKQTGGTYLMFHKDGNLLMHTGSGYNWVSDIYVAGRDYQNTGRIYIVLQDDGNLVMEWDGGNYTDVIGNTATGNGANSPHYGSMKL